MSETLRRRTNQDRVLFLLQTHAKVSTMDLVEVGGIRATGRISDLRKLGYRIDAEPAGGGLWYYRFVSSPQPPTQMGLL